MFVLLIMPASRHFRVVRAIVRLVKSNAFPYTGMRGRKESWNGKRAILASLSSSALCCFETREEEKTKSLECLSTSTQCKGKTIKEKEGFLRFDPG